MREDNVICCDQILQVSSSNEVQKPLLITGTIAKSDKNYYLQYQWQSQTLSDRGIFSNWTNIPNTNSKDYFPPTPEFIPGAGRNQPKVPTYIYRRIATENAYKGEEYYSNEVSLSPSTNIPNTTVSSLVIYPNPATTTINIENTDTRTASLNIIDVSIVNIMGSVVNKNNYTIINPYLFNIDVSNLVKGTYFMNISTNNGRTNTEQFTFIKN